jgi:hypothetical protein
MVENKPNCIENKEMDIYETRRLNLQHLADERFPGYGQRAKLGDLMDWKHQRASALLREKNPKNIGGTAARLVEQKFKLPRGWLDEQHPNLWDGTINSVREALKASYTTSVDQIKPQSLPLLKDDEAVRWISGERFTPTSRMQFPIMPMMTISNDAFVLEETTSSMPPQKPGDFYYIDPLTTPESGEWAAFIIGSKVVVGIYEKGRVSDRLEFTNGKEAAIEITEDQHAGKVLTRMNGDFARGFGG